MSDQQTVVKSINAIKGGPRALRLYMDVCAKCGTCASVCPVYYGKQDPKYNPANRSDLVRSLYQRYNTLSGKLLGRLVGAQDFDQAQFEDWSDIFYSCTTACANCKRQLGQLMEQHGQKVTVCGVHDMLSRAILIDGKAANRQSYEQ